jgi:hypothetical protein
MLTTVSDALTRRCRFGDEDRARRVATHPPERVKRAAPLAPWTDTSSGRHAKWVVFLQRADRAPTGALQGVRNGGGHQGSNQRPLGFRATRRSVNSLMCGSAAAASPYVERDAGRAQPSIGSMSSASGPSERRPFADQRGIAGQGEADEGDWISRGLRIRPVALAAHRRPGGTGWPVAVARRVLCWPPRSSTTLTGAGPTHRGSRSAATRRQALRWSRS